MARHASDAQRRDGAYMLQAVAEGGALALQYASEQLTADRAFMSAACRRDGLCLIGPARQLLNQMSCTELSVLRGAARDVRG